MPWVPIVPPPGAPGGSPLPPDGSIATDRARPDPVIKVPPERVRESYCYSLTVTPAPGAVRVAVTESCRWCDAHVHTPAPTTPPSVIAIDGRDGSVRAAARDYETSGTPPVTRRAAQWHVTSGEDGHRIGTWTPGGTETATAIRRTRLEAQDAQGIWHQQAGTFDTWEREVISTPLPSYIVWDAPKVMPCTLDRVFGVLPQDG